MRKQLAFLLTLLLVLGSMVPAFALPLPTDVAGKASEEAVKALSEAGIIQGYPDGTFRPENGITRAEALTLLAKALDYDISLSEAGEGQVGFSDAGGHWAEPYIKTVGGAGLIQGYPDGTFRPNNPLSYNEIVAMLVRALGYTDESLSGDWPDNYLDKAASLGITKGVLSTGGPVSRGDVAILLYQAWDKPIGTVKDGIWTANDGNDTMKARAGVTEPGEEKPVIPSSGGRSSGGGGGSSKDGMNLKDIIGVVKKGVDGEGAFDAVSYVYMGWRTTGGPWQNHVIKDYLVGEMVDAGYQYSEGDMSGASDGDYVWVQHDDSSSLVWAPQYASLEVTHVGNAPEVKEVDELNDQVETSDVTGDFSDQIEAFNVIAHGFDPTSDIYMDHYGAEYGVTSIEEMYEWITKKEPDGTRTNVANGLEAELNKRAHLATNSCFTDPADTSVDEAEGVEGEVAYIGTVKSTKIDNVTVYYGSKTGLEGNAELEGKVLLSDSSNSSTFNLARQVGAIACMTTYALDEYNNPVIDDEVWYTNSARYASGTTAANAQTQMKAGKPIVTWNLSLDQEDAMHELLEAGPVTVKCVSIGSIYSMAFADEGEGQLTAIAEIAGTTKADERVMVMAHVQEPSACDNATGVGLQVELAVKLKKMIDSGKLERPERTITFFWGDEMQFSRLWLNAHPEEKQKVVCTIDLDMVGEDPAKTGGPMRIEKTPDPSAIYNYTCDVLPGQPPYTDENNFVRLPDSHTLWGASSVPKVGGLYLNDLYMAATQEVIRSVDSDFRVAVCPYEGGSDHTVFLNAGIPSVLTWHFTDYVYHTTVDTMDKVSAREMQNVGIISLATAYMAAIADDYETKEMMKIVHDAAVDRFALEAENTVNHFAWAKEKGKNMEETLALETEVLKAWGTWYVEAIESCGNYFLESPNSSYQTLEDRYIEKINLLLDEALNRATRTYLQQKEAS